jgi:hypothetical protein
MSIKNLLMLVDIILALVLIAGCAKTPQQDIDAVKAILEAAKMAEARAAFWKHGHVASTYFISRRSPRPPSRYLPHGNEMASRLFQNGE